MTDFEKIKQFFIEYTDTFVAYNVITRGQDEKNYTDYIINNIYRNPNVKDFFALEFPFDSGKNLVHIDSLDSFVFDFYFLDYGDKIVIDDAERTCYCGVEAPEGNGVLANQKEIVEKYLTKNGFSFENYNIVKETSLETFVKDTINFIKVLQTLNNIQPSPPYILELDEAKETVDLLTRCWIGEEKFVNDSQGRKLALFDNHKNLQEKQTCSENSYPPFFNKHKFVGVFFNQDGKVLVAKNTNATCKAYDFAISDFVLDNEWSSLEGLQRAVQQTFGIDFFFGEIAPCITTLKNKVVTDYYVVNDYNVTIEQISKLGGQYLFDWLTKEEIIALIKVGDMDNYDVNLMKYLLEIK